MNELERLQRECHIFLESRAGNQMYGTDPNVLSLQKMIARVEELEDLTHELKAQHNVGEIVDLKAILSQKEIELA